VAVIRKGAEDDEHRDAGHLHGDLWTPKPGEVQTWGDIRVSGQEEVILGDLTFLADGGPVTLPQEAEGTTKVKRETAAADHHPAEPSPGVVAALH
jgi:hypothetical protein